MSAAAVSGTVEQDRTEQLAAAGSPIVLVIHGGAGTIRREDMTAEREAEYRAALEAALTAGFAVLEGGGSSLDAVETTVRLMEDSPLFNAGKGAVFTADGRNELDASIMDGATLRAGAVARVTTIKNPISAARAVMERTEHVLLAGEGAEQFAADEGLALVEPAYFFTQRRWDQLEERRRRERAEATPGPASAPPAAGRTSAPPSDTSASATEREEAPPPETVREPTTAAPSSAFGTVGALALDRAGRLAAATSTGGMTYKRFGRVGDSPLIGAGTYADPQCAVSGTGHGEFFIRYAVAYDVCARVRYLGQPIGEAARSVIHGVLLPAGGEGGVIALDARGNVALELNTEGMYRGWRREGEPPQVAIYGEE